jgi:Maltokinase N-terminal cap domain
MAIIYNTTMHPSKLELLAGWLPQQAWYAGAGDGLTRAGGFRLDDPDGDVGIEFMVVMAGNGAAYLVPMTYRGAPLEGADDALIGTSEHGVLGNRWIYDGEHDPVLRAQLAALLRGEVLPQAQSKSNTPDATVLIRPTDSAAGVHIKRLLNDGDAPASDGGYVSATWRRADGSIARGVVASAA